MKQKDILFLAVSFTFLVFIYLVSSLYHSSVTSTIPEDVNVQITPISPNFDDKTISDLKKRTVVSPVYQIGPASPAPQASISAKTNNTATKSAGGI